MRGFPEFPNKYAWCGFFLNFMHKNCIIEGMLKFTFIKNDAKSMLLLTIYFFQVCSAGAAPRDTAIVYVTVYTQVVK